MNKYKAFWICFLFLFIANRLSAQRSELGLQIGASFYIGDLNTKLFAQSDWTGGVFYRYNIDTRWALRLSGIYARLRADDAFHDNPRNLSFRSDVWDFSAMMEINFLNFFTGSKGFRFSPYLTGGVGLFFFNPQAHYFADHGKTMWVDLRSLRTEGQGLAEYPDAKKYSLAQFSVPFGIGFKYSISSKISIGLEWTMRYTVTDYLDDVSGFYANPAILASEFGPISADLADRSEEKHAPGMQRGSVNGNDWYSFAMFTIAFKMGEKEETCPAYKKSAMERFNPRRKRK